MISDDLIANKCFLSSKQERMIQKGFQITKIESVMQNVFTAAAATISTGNKSRDFFRKMAKAAVSHEKKDWNSVVSISPK